MTEHNGVTFEQMVDSLAKPGEAILTELTAMACHNMHMIVGVCGEIGELIEAILDDDQPTIIEELGDTEFYLEGFRGKLGIVRENPNPSAFPPISTTAMLLAVHSSKLLDIVKKQWAYGKDFLFEEAAMHLHSIDRNLFFVYRHYGYTREQALLHNMQKLSKRYENFQYSNEQAIARADKILENARSVPDENEDTVKPVIEE